MKLRKRFGQDIKLNDPARPENNHKLHMCLKKMSLLNGFGQAEWLENMSDILLSCNAALPPSQSLMPVFPVPEDETSTTLLRKIV